MKVPLADATRQGATAGIADRIATGLASGKPITDDHRRGPAAQKADGGGPENPGTGGDRHRCAVPATVQQRAPAQYRSVVAARVDGSEVLDVVSRRLRTPRRGEVRVRVEACGVSAVDVQARRGLSTYPPRFPFVPGYAGVGVVDAGGDRVVVVTEKGGYAEYVDVDRHPLLRVPAGLNAGEVVAVALNYLVAHQALSRTARIRPGQAVLIIGAAGGIGTAIVQLGQLLGLRMYGVDTAAKHPWLADHGVVPLDLSGEDVVEALRRPEPAGVDAVLDGVGGTWVDRGLAVLRPGGVLVACANPGGPAATLRLIGRAPPAAGRQEDPSLRDDVVAAGPPPAAGGLGHPLRDARGRAHPPGDRRPPPTVRGGPGARDAGERGRRGPPGTPRPRPGYGMIRCRRYRHVPAKDSTVPARGPVGRGPVEERA